MAYDLVLYIYHICAKYEISLKLATHFLQNISLIGLVVLGKKSFEWFLPYMGMAAILNFQS